MKIAARCIYCLPLTPNFLTVDLKDEEWMKFLHGDKKARIEIIRKYIKTRGPSEISEIAWIPLEGLKESELMELELECSRLKRNKERPEN